LLRDEYAITVGRVRDHGVTAKLYDGTDGTSHFLYGTAQFIPWHLWHGSQTRSISYKESIASVAYDIKLKKKHVKADVLCLSLQFVKFIPWHSWHGSQTRSISYEESMALVAYDIKFKKNMCATPQHSVAPGGNSRISLQSQKMRWPPLEAIL